MQFCIGLNRNDYGASLIALRVTSAASSHCAAVKLFPKVLVSLAMEVVLSVKVKYIIIYK